MDRRTRIYIALFVVALVTGFVASMVSRADASVKPATAKGAKFKAYPVPKQCQHRDCRYVADDRCEIEDPDTASHDGTVIDAYRMLVGFPEFQINKRGQFHVKSVEFLGYNEYGEHYWDRVGVYVRIPGTKAHRSQRVTPIYWFQHTPHGGKALSDDPGSADGNGWTVRGLEVVFVGYDRGKSCTTVVSPWDVPWAQR